MAQADELRELVRRFYEEVVNGHSVDAADKLVAADFVEHEPGFGELQGLEGFKQGFGAFMAAVPDLEAEVHDVIVEGDKVCTRVTFRGTQQGEMMGIPATGKRFEIQVIDIVRVVDGKAAEHWGATDMLGLLQQVGVIQPPG